MRKLPENYQLFDAVYNQEFPVDQYYVILFDVLPSKFETLKSFNVDIIDYLTKNGFKLISKIQKESKRNKTVANLLLNKEKRIIIKTESTNNFDNLTFEISYDITKGELTKLINWDEISQFQIKDKKSNISLVKSEMGHLDTEEYDLVSPEIDLELNYGKKFIKIHNLIIDRLNTQNGKGIILLHGDPGTGKTSYLKYLTNLIKEKDILFIPPSMAEMLSEPSIIPFLMEHKNSILIIEDAERVISDREYNGSSAGVSNILNLTDGIMGDCLGIQVIATFNMKREKIDRALLRSGRLIAEHKFDKLSIEETNRLLKSIGKDYISKEEMTLSDIYNIDVEIYKSDDEYKIGFNKN